MRSTATLHFQEAALGALQNLYPLVNAESQTIPAYVPLGHKWVAVRQRFSQFGGHAGHAGHAGDMRDSLRVCRRETLLNEESITYRHA